MTKERRTVTLSKELDEVVAFLASAKQMTLSEFVESRLRMNQEILRQIEKFQNLPEEPAVPARPKKNDRVGKHIIFSKPSAKKSQLLSRQ